tara:strand:- start:5329 stop:5712 length:384 start_codon:yes stop_codon:yes gene_type:complete
MNKEATMTATLQQQQHLINVLAETPKQFNYDIPVYRTQTITLEHKLTADELKQWALERHDFEQQTIDYYIPTQKEWEDWNQQYLDNLQDNHAWAYLEDWNTDWERTADYGDWELDGEIDTWTDKEGA